MRMEELLELFYILSFGVYIYDLSFTGQNYPREGFSNFECKSVVVEIKRSISTQ